MSEWPDFSYENITRIFETQLGWSYKGEGEPKPLPRDLTMYNEATADDALRRFPISVVNYALSDALKDVGKENAAHYGRGGRCPCPNYVPDWSVVSDRHMARDTYLNIVPGDTKVSSKWTSAMADSRHYFTEWQKVVSQVLSYMAQWSVRYGFIVTDAEVVVLRAARQYVAAGIAAARPVRSSVGRHNRQASDISMMMSSDPVEASIESSLSFRDDDPLNWDYNLQYCIPWSSHGSKLTGKLALWAVAMMSLSGDNHIDYSYPDLDTWRKQADGRGIIHNTFGATRSHAGRHCNMQEPNPHWQLIVQSTKGKENDDYSGGSDEDEATDDISEETDLPQFSRAASIAAHDDSMLPQQAGGQPSTCNPGKVTKDKRFIVEVKKQESKYTFKDAKGHTKSSIKSDWVKVDNG